MNTPGSISNLRTGGFPPVSIARVLARLASDLREAVRTNTALEDSRRARILEICSTLSTGLRERDLAWEVSFLTYNRKYGPAINGLGAMLSDTLIRPAVPARISYSTAAYLTGISETSLRCLTKTGQLPVHSLDKRQFFDPDDLEAFLRSQYTGDSSSIASLLLEPKDDSGGDVIPGDILGILVRSGRLPHVCGHYLRSDILRIEAAWRQFERALKPTTEVL